MLLQFLAKFYRFFFGKLESNRKFKACWKDAARSGKTDDHGLCTTFRYPLLEEESCRYCPYRSQNKKEAKNE